MFLWFIGTAVVTIWFVFGDPRFDYRLLIVGSVLPSVIDGVSGGRWLMHSLVVSVGLLAVVMLVTAGRDERRRRARRTLLGLPLGMMLHLVFTGAWTDTATFWWPFSGASLPTEALPEVTRGWWNLPLEAVGSALVVWVVVSAGLTDPDRRSEFWRTGRLHLPARR